MTDALARWATLPGARATLTEARERIEAGVGDRADLGSGLNESGRGHVGQLLGMGWVASGRPVRLGDLRAAVARDGGDLVELLVETGGPLRDRRQERATHTAERADALTRLRSRLAGCGLPPAVVDLAVARRWLGPPAGPEIEGRLDAMDRLMRVLPADGVLLAELAAQLLGNPHALDRTAEAGRLASRLLAARAAAQAGVTDVGLARASDEAAGRAARWRTTWDAVGVSCDRVSSTVLVLNVALAGTASAVALAGAAPGEPVWLTARSLAGEWTADAAGDSPVGGPAAEVRVCENPAVVEAAADRLGVACRPVVCTFGRPSGAAWALLDGLAAAGVRLLVTGDRDDAGRSITVELLDRLPGAREWRPEVAGVYEEDRLPALLADLRSDAV